MPDKKIKRASVKLTTTQVKNLIPEAKQYIVRDTEIRGLGLMVSPGGTKTWILEKKIDGKTRRIKLGNELPESQARNMAKELIGDIARGIDPAERKKQERRESLSLRTATDEYLLRKMKESTRDDVRRAMKHLDDWMGTPVREIKPAMVEKRHKELTLKATGSGARANLTMRYLRAILNHCSIQHADDDGNPFIQNNPVNRLSAQKQWNRVQRRQTRVTTDQLPGWFNTVLHGLVGLKYADEIRDCLLLSMLTGVRPGEARSLAWSNVDLARRTMVFPDTKNHTNHELPITNWLASILEARQGISGAQEYVFSDSTGIRPPNARRAQLRIEEATGVHVMPTDLRRTFISTASNLKSINVYTLKRMLNHTVEGNDVTAGYVVVSTEDLREPMQRIEDRILIDAGLKSGDVIELRARA